MSPTAGKRKRRTIIDILRTMSNKRRAPETALDTETLAPGQPAQHPQAATPRARDPKPANEQTRRTDENTTQTPTHTTHRYLHVVTHNVRGLATSLANVLCNAQTWDADVLVLTETKTNNRTTWLKDVLRKEPKQYRLYCSSKAVSGTMATRSAGVAIAITGKYSRSTGHVTHTQMKAPLQGYVCHCTIATPQSTPLHIIGVYCPEDTQTRTAIYAYCKTILKQTNDAGDHLLVAGDFNAVLSTEDRSTGSLDPADRMHITFASDSKMAPVGKGTPTRPHSYQQIRHGQPTHSSRIDDILLCPTLQRAVKEGAKEHLDAYETVSIPGGHFDHLPVHVRIPANAIRFWDPAIPTPQTPPGNDDGSSRWRDVILPIPAAVLRATEAQIEASLTSDICTLQAYLHAAVEDTETALADHTADPEATRADDLMDTLRSTESVQRIDIEAAAAMLQTTLNKSMDILLSLCLKKPPTTGKIHPRRTVSKAIRHLHKVHVQLKTELQSELQKQNKPPAPSAGQMDVDRQAPAAAGDTQIKRRATRHHHTTSPTHSRDSTTDATTHKP